MCQICGTPSYDDVCGECYNKCERYDKIVEHCEEVIQRYATEPGSHAYDAGYCAAVVEIRAKTRE